MSKRIWIRGILTGAFGLIICGFTALARGDNASPRQAKLNGGYYLLHALAEDEAQLPILLDLKTAPPEVQTYADHISKLGKETEGDIEKMGDRDPALRYDKNPLPEIEQDTRDSIKDDKQHMLLFGTKGPEFVRALMNSQIEASTYAINLSKVMADQESSPDRAQTLRHLSAKWLEMRKEAFRMLRD